MNVKIVKVVNPIRRHRQGKGATQDKGYARGFVDGFLVTCTQGKGWGCSCPDDQCGHPDALAAILHADALSMLEGEQSQ